MAAIPANIPHIPNKITELSTPNLLDSYLKGERYRCLTRVTGPIIKPLPIDDTVMTGYMTYNCDVEIKTNTIYRRK